MVGWATSGGYARWSETSVALGDIKIEQFDVDADHAIEIIGDARPARVQPEPLFDPQAERMRG